MLEAVKTGSGEGPVIGLSSRCRIFRLPAAWGRGGIVFTRNLLLGTAAGSVKVDPMCRKHREISSFSLTNHAIRASDHAWLRARRLLGWHGHIPDSCGMRRSTLTCQGVKSV